MPEDAHRHIGRLRLIAIVSTAFIACGRMHFDPLRDASEADAAIDAPVRPPPGHVLSLDGGGYVVADTISASLTTAMTFAAWVYPRATQPASSSNSNHIAAFNGPIGGATENLGLIQWIPTSQQFYYFDALETYGSDAPFAISTESWHFVAISIDTGGQGTIYQDGVVLATFSTTRVLQPDVRFSLGQEWDGGAATDLFAGLEDEVTVYRVGRTEAQILDEMARGPDVLDPDLVAYFTFEAGATDASGHGNAGALNGTATIVTSP